jgi:hypothetical protein
MNIKHLKAGDKVILRRTNQYGRYEYAQATIAKIAAGNAVVGVGSSYNRDTGKENGILIPPHMTKWEAFPADHEPVATEAKEWKDGKKFQVVDPDVVRMRRAFDRLVLSPLDEVGKIDLIVKAVVAHYGKPEDFKETD